MSSDTGILRANRIPDLPYRRGLVRTGVLVVVGVATAMLVVTGIAYACTAQATLEQIRPRSGEAGSMVSLSGAGWHDGDVEITWNSPHGEHLKTVQGSSFNEKVTIPQSADGGAHYIVATAYDELTGQVEGRDSIPFEVTSGDPYDDGASDGGGGSSDEGGSQSDDESDSPPEGEQETSDTEDSSDQNTSSQTDDSASSSSTEHSTSSSSGSPSTSEASGADSSGAESQDPAQQDSTAQEPTRSRPGSQSYTGQLLVGS